MAAATITVIAIGAAVGAAVGAVGTYAAGGRGDALWKGALTGAVAGAVTGGVGSWASAAGYGAIAAGGMAGAAGGIASGALGTALSGGTGSDYLKNIAFGGLGGAALGAAGGAAFGGEAGAAEAGVNPVTGEAVPTGSPEITALPDVDAATGMQTGTSAAPAVETSVTGTTAPTTQANTVTPLADTVSNVNAGTQPAPTSLSTTAPTTSGATPSLGETAFTYDDYPSQAMIDKGIANPSNTTELVNSPSFKMKELGADLGMDTFGYGKTLGQTATTGTGKGMGLEDYLKMQGKAQLLGGGIKALGALATAPETQQNRQQLMDLYNEQMDQTRAQRQAAQGMQNRLEQSYVNPESYLGTPEAAATRSAALQKILAQNAAAGRRTAGSAAYNQLMMNQLQNLGNYRQGLRSGIQYPTSYGTAAQIANMGQAYSPTADIFGGLSSMATPLSLYSLFG